MSIEQALSDNTAALNALAAIIRTFNLTPAAEKPVAAPKATKTKAEPVKVAEPAATVAEPTPQPAAGEPVEGDAAGTRYFVNTKHNTTFRILPTDPQVIPADSEELTGERFLALQPTPASGAASVESSTTATVEQPAAPATIDFKTMMEKMRELHAIGGNAALAPILHAVKADKIGSIAEDMRKQAYDLTVAALAKAA